MASGDSLAARVSVFVCAEASRWREKLKIRKADEESRVESVNAGNKEENVMFVQSAIVMYVHLY